MIHRCVLLSLFLLLAACDSPTDPTTNNDEPFSLAALSGAYVLVEGDSQGIDIPLDLTRSDGYTGEVTLSVTGVTDSDTQFVTSTLSPGNLSQSDDQSSVNMKLDIGVLPIQAQQRQFVITGTDGNFTNSTTITVDVTPTSAPDVYLLIGQSNMVGFGGDGDKDAGVGGLDEPHPRIFQLNASRNDQTNIFNTSASYTDPNLIAEQPLLVIAEDPLHVPQNPLSQAKSEDYIGMGLSFAKRALQDTSANIVLVPAAWSGTAFCAQSFANGNWNALPPSDGSLGNTLLFDRALARLDLALQESGGILRGILWHQGETDANPAHPQCANLYQQNLELMVSELRRRARVDGRGESARSQTANIPFVLGTMSVGADENGDFSILFDEKAIVDSVHRNIATTIPHAAVSVNDDLTPANGFPCGNQDCIHFGSSAFRVIGPRYYESLLQAATN